MKKIDQNMLLYFVKDSFSAPLIKYEVLDLSQDTGHTKVKFFICGTPPFMECSTSRVASQSEKSL